jgi:hypothetical protein
MGYKNIFWCIAHILANLLLRDHNFFHKTSGTWQRLVTRIIQKLWILPGALQFSPVIQSPKRYEAPWRGLQSVLVHSSPAIHLQLLVHSIATTPQQQPNSSQICGNIAILSSFSYKWLLFVTWFPSLNPLSKNLWILSIVKLSIQ